MCPLKFDKSDKSQSESFSPKKALHKKKKELKKNRTIKLSNLRLKEIVDHLTDSMSSEEMVATQE